MIRLFRQYLSLRSLIFILGEGILIFCAVTIASLFLINREFTNLTETISLMWPKILLVSLATQLSLYFNDLYEFKSNENILELATRLTQSIGVASIILAVIYFIWPEAIIGRWIFFISIVFLLLFLVSWRLLYAFILKHRIFTNKALIIGAGDLARNILQEMDHHRDISYDIKYLLHPDQEEENQEGLLQNIPIKTGFENMCDLAEAEEVSHIIVALDQKRGIMPYKELLNCKIRGIEIIDGESFYERITGKVLVEKINPSWLIFSDGFVKSKISRIIKRFVGMVLGAVMLILLSPLLLMVALAIKLESQGPVFFKQERVGEFGLPFTLVKFRSMRADAEKYSGPVWAEEDDPRITRIGRLIRKLRIDELPQIWNVFKGDMSFVGPRPERAFFVEQLKEKIPYYNERFSVKPGITGWAQIKYPYGSTEKDALEKLKYDLYYIKNMSLIMDLIVIFHTVKTVLLGRGSR